ncbi:MAG: hypothetical protein ACRD4H_12105, partial [Candidatus Acidiferrales bacterium]
AGTLHGERLIFSMFDNHNGGTGRDAAHVLDTIAQAMVEELGTTSKKPTKKAAKAPAKKLKKRT